MTVLSLSTDDALGGAEVLDRDRLELDAEVLGDDRAAGEDRDVLEHLLAAIAEARRLDGADLERTAELVDDERGERLALDVLGDDDEGTALLRDLLEQRDDVGHHRDLLLADEDVRVVDLGRHLLRVGHEVGRQVAAVELHALDHLELGLHALRFFDGDDAFLADLLHRAGEHVADGLVAVGADRADLSDVLLVLRRRRELLDLGDHRGDREVDAALQLHRVVARFDEHEALRVDRLREDRGGRRAVAGLVAGLGSDLADHLRAHVLELVVELDLLRDRDAVLRDDRRAEALLDDDVTTLGAERDLDGVGEGS